MSKTVLFQTIKFCISTQFSSIWPIDRTLSGATTPGQSGPGSDGIEGVLYILQSSSITEISPSDCLVLYPEHLLGVVLPLCREAVGLFYSPSRLGYDLLWEFTEWKGIRVFGAVNYSILCIEVGCLLLIIVKLWLCFLIVVQGAQVENNLLEDSSLYPYLAIFAFVSGLLLNLDYFWKWSDIIPLYCSSPPLHCLLDICSKIPCKDLKPRIVPNPQFEVDNFLKKKMGYCIYLCNEWFFKINFILKNKGSFITHDIW